MHSAEKSECLKRRIHDAPRMLLTKSRASTMPHRHILLSPSSLPLFLAKAIASEHSASVEDMEPEFVGTNARRYPAPAQGSFTKHQWTTCPCLGAIHYSLRS